MTIDSDRRVERTLRVEGATPLELPWDGDPSSIGVSVRSETIGVECASGDWLEDDWTGVPVFDLLEQADVPPETTHVQFESVDGDLACVPLADLEGGLVAVDDGTEAAENAPRFVSPHVLGPRTVKNLVCMRPLALAAGDDRVEYEALPIDD
ncbi:MAG: molybdopterin-dependent oxidoreductase [Halobacteriota archaeon]